MVFIIISPGNENRASYFTQSQNISELLLIAWQSTTYILKNIFKWPGNVLTIIQLIGISLYVGISNNRIKNISKSYVIKKFIIILPFLIFILLFLSYLPPLLYSYFTIYIVRIISKKVRRYRPIIQKYFPYVDLPDLQWSILDTFDSVTPTYASTHAREEVNNWLDKAGFSDVHQTKWGEISFISKSL